MGHCILELIIYYSRIIVFSVEVSDAVIHMDAFPCPLVCVLAPGVSKSFGSWGRWRFSLCGCCFPSSSGHPLGPWRRAELLKHVLVGAVQSTLMGHAGWFKQSYAHSLYK